MKLKALLLTLTAVCATTASAQKLLGGDISLLPEYEKKGTVFRNDAGTPVNPLESKTMVGMPCAYGYL